MLRSNPITVTDAIFADHADPFFDQYRPFIPLALRNIIKHYYGSLDNLFRCQRTGNPIYHPILIFSPFQQTDDRGRWVNSFACFYEKNSFTEEELDGLALRDDQVDQTAKELIDYLADPKLPLLYPVSYRKMDDKAQKFYGNCTLIRTENINVAQDLRFALRQAIAKKQDSINLYQVFKHYDRYPVARGNYRSGNFRGFHSFIDIFPFIIQFMMFGVTMLYRKNEMEMNLNANNGILGCALIVFSNLVKLTYPSLKFSAFRIHLSHPNLKEAYGMPPATKQMINDVDWRFARQMIYSCVSFSNEILFIRKPMMREFFNWIDHAENAAAVEVLRQNGRPFSLATTGVVAASLASLGILQLARMDNFNFASPSKISLLKLCVYPLMSLPKLILNSHALVSKLSHFAKNPRALLEPPRNALGFRSEKNEWVYSACLMLVPLSYALLSFYEDGRNWAVAATFFSALVDASSWWVPENNWTPGMFRKSWVNPKIAAERESQRRVVRRLN